MAKVRLEYTVSIYVDVDLDSLNDLDEAQQDIERQLNKWGLLAPKVFYKDKSISPSVQDIQYYDWDTVEEFGS